MKKLCLVFLAITLFSTPLLAQENTMNPLLQSALKSLTSIKPEYSKLNNGFSGTLDIPFSITRTSPIGAEIKLNLTKLSCKNCDAINKTTFKGIVDLSIIKIIDSIIETRKKTSSNPKVTYKNADGDVSIQAFLVDTFEEDEMNDLLNSIFEYIYLSITVTNIR